MRRRSPLLLKSLDKRKAPMDGARHVWWNFVSSSSERIEQAKADWREGRLGSVPGDTEFIPLPVTPAVQTQPVDYP